MHLTCTWQEGEEASQVPAVLPKLKEKHEVARAERDTSELVRDGGSGREPTPYQEPQPALYKVPQPAPYQEPQPAPYKVPQPATYKVPQPATYQEPQPATYKVPQPAPHRFGDAKESGQSSFCTLRNPQGNAKPSYGGHGRPPYAVPRNSLILPPSAPQIRGTLYIPPSCPSFVRLHYRGAMNMAPNPTHPSCGLVAQSYPSHKLEPSPFPNTSHSAYPSHKLEPSNLDPTPSLTHLTARTHLIANAYPSCARATPIMFLSIPLHHRTTPMSHPLAPSYTYPRAMPSYTSPRVMLSYTYPRIMPSYTSPCGMPSYTSPRVMPSHINHPVPLCPVVLP